MITIRMRIAVWLNDHFVDACWSTLVMWAVGYASTVETFWPDVFEPRGHWRGQGCSVQDGAYCGKCELTGRLWRDRREDNDPLISFAGKEGEA